MRKTLLTLSIVAAGLMTIAANAQEVKSNEEYLAETPANKVAFEPSCKHWFIQALGGINMPFSMPWAQKSQDVKGDKYSWSAGIAVGQWHSPYFGTRLALDYNNIKAVNVENKLLELRTFNPHFDFMFDMTNYFAPYDADRVFHVIPYLGVGYFGSNRLGSAKDQKAADQNFKNIFKNTGVKNEFWGEIDHAITANVGIDFNINFTRRVALTIAPQATFVPGFDAADVITGVRGGLTFNVGEVEFAGVQPMDWELINGLQGQINDLRSQNAELSKRPVRCPECPEVQPQTIVSKEYENVVYFRIGRAKIDRNQEINIFNTAEYVKANNVAITVTGYADVKTGSADYNLKLSEKRARNVADKLINEYGVPSELITIDYKGSDVQPYDVNAWNRVVIMKTK